MAESPRRVDLRLTIPASAAYAGLAGDIAARFARYSGATNGDASDVRKAVDAIAARARGAAAESITFEIAIGETALVVTAEVGGRAEQLTCPLP